MEQYDFIAIEKIFNFRPVMNNGKWGLVDDKFRVVVPLTLDSKPKEYKEFIRCKENGKQGLLDNNGKTVLPNIYDCIKFSEYDRIIVSMAGKQGLMDYTGNVLLPTIYDGVCGFSSRERYIVVSNNMKKGVLHIIKKTAKVVIPIRYADVTLLSDDLAIIENREHKQGLFDIQTRKVLVSPKYEAIKVYGIYMAVKDSSGLWGYIDKTGKEIVSCKYDNVEGFNNGFATVHRDSRWGYINTEGIEVTKFVYNKVGQVLEDGSAEVSYDGIKGVIYLK